MPLGPGTGFLSHGCVGSRFTGGVHSVRITAPAACSRTQFVREGQLSRGIYNRVILLWELTLLRDATDEPREDLLYRTVWTKVERFLSEH